MDLVSIVMALPKALSAIFNLYEGCNEVRDRFLIKKIIKFSEKKWLCAPKWLPNGKMT